MRYLSALALLLAACTSSAPPAPPMTSAPQRPARGTMVAALDLTLPMSWWHESTLAGPLSLTSDQFQRLDALGAKQEDVARLERDSMMAARELRTSFDASEAKATDIVAAGAHARSLRDALLGAQIELLAAQREILTLDQWRTLQSELMEERRSERREGMRGRGPGGGRGRGPGGGGRRPWG